MRPRRVPRGAEVAIALGVGAACFAVVAVVVAVLDPAVLVALFGVLCIAAVVAIQRLWGIEYAVPAALAGLLAFDWFEFPPTHPHEFPDAANLANLLVYLGVAVFVGELAAHAGRRAEVSEAARSELAEEQAALRRVATLVARGVSTDQVFAAVADEVCALLDVDGARVVRLEGEVPRLEAVVPVAVRELGIPSAVGAPIVVDGHPWGAMLAWTLERPLRSDAAAARLADFTELVATAISNTASREQLARLADEQAALRRVATLVARRVDPPEVFAAVAREVGQLLGVDATHIGRYEPDGTTTGVGSWSRSGDHIPVGTRVEVEGNTVTGRVRRTGRPARMDCYEGVRGSIADRLQREIGIRSSVGAPITAEGRLWGVMIASSKQDDPLPRDTESRIAAFTELVATAIANTEARAGIRRLADEQAALRRVATLVAREASPEEVFTAVTTEVGGVLGSRDVAMLRYEGDGTATVVADGGAGSAPVVAGTRVPLEGDNVSARVLRTGQPARIDDYSKVSGSLGEWVRNLGTRSAVGSPILVGGRVWGALVVASRQEPLPADAEERIGEFTALVATAISNIEARSELAASRARIVAATDAERRRVVRDLHDGAQQRLVHTVITLKLARQAMEDGKESAFRLMDEALDHAEQATAEVRELAHGILPSVLTHGGLRAGVNALAARMPVPVETDVAVDRLPAPVEATAYFVVAEALTNVAKHAHAGHAAVTAHVEHDTLRLRVRDDGVGGARSEGSGLVGLADRLAVLDGRLQVESPADGGTVVAAAIPLPGRLRRQ